MREKSRWLIQAGSCLHDASRETGFDKIIESSSQKIRLLSPVSESGQAKWANST